MKGFIAFLCLFFGAFYPLYVFLAEHQIYSVGVAKYPDTFPALSLIAFFPYAVTHTLFIIPFATSVIQLLCSYLVLKYTIIPKSNYTWTAFCITLFFCFLFFAISAISLFSYGFCPPWAGSC